ncbi:MAG: redoxin domain-containing protein, partial [Limisphaerales bacterium]
MKSALLSVLLLMSPCLCAAEFPVMKLGASLPDFSLPAADGRTYTPKDFADAKLLAIIFTSNHCPTAQAYEDRIKSLVDDYKARGVAIIAINPNSAAAVRFDELGYTDLDDTLDAMKIRAEHKQFNFPYLDDGPTEKFSKQLGPIATPHVFIFDADRKLRYQ